MEVDKEEPEPPLLSNIEGTNRVSIQKDEKTSGEKKAMEKYKTRKEQVKQSQKRIIKLQSDLTAFVTNIQTAADANVVQKRTELNKAKEIRAELLENDVKSTQEKFDEIASRFSIVSQKVTHPELQEALNRQQQLCAVVIQEKKKLINELQQELKLGDDRYVKDLRRNAKEIDLMIERMGDQIKIFTQAYREELAQIERVHQQELDFLLSEDINKREQDFKKLCDNELKRLTERRRKVEEYEENIHRLRLKHTLSLEASNMENNAKKQDQVRKDQNIKTATVVEILKHKVQEAEIKDFKLSLIKMKRRIFIHESTVQKLKSTYVKEQKELTKLSHNLSEDYKRKIQKYELLNAQIKHFAVADARKFKEMWSMIDADVKQLAERALLIDSVICKRLLDLSWEQPHTAVSDFSGPSQPQELVRNSDSGPETEEENVFRETQKKIKELLCNETDFLMEAKVLKLLSSLENEEQTNVKLVTLLYSLDLDDKDLPELTDFMLKYEQQQREQTKDACAASSDLAEAAETRATTSELIHPNHVLPALKSFLKHRRGRSSHHDSSENDAYWENLGNVISEEKLRLWDEAEEKLKQYHAVLTEISDLTLETDHLKQKNAELRMQLQQRLTSTVG